jgi:hypothetical protein
MEPISLVVAALVAGATAGITDTASQIVRDLYSALKTGLMNKFNNQPTVQTAIVELEKEPDSQACQEKVKENLSLIDIQSDQNLLDIAQQLFSIVEKPKDESGKYKITMQNPQGVVIGDQTNVNQNFTNKN